jgi:hypothetical protein
MDYSLALKLGTTKQFDFFNFQKKDESTAYNRGYNKAIKKCNQKMRRMLSYMSNDYHLVMRDDDDDGY